MPESKLCLLPFHRSVPAALSGRPPKHRRGGWGAAGRPQLSGRGWASQLVPSAGACHLELDGVERMQGWSTGTVIYSFVGKRALLSVRNEKEMIVKVVRVKNSPNVALKNPS